MEYNTQNQDERYMSRRQYRRSLMQERIEKLLGNPDATEYPERLYPTEAKWLEKNYPVVFIFPDETLDKTQQYPCIVRKKENA